jgi:hypothetical protein
VRRLLLCLVLLLAVPACVLAQRPPAGIIVTKDVDFYVAPCGYAVTYTITVQSESSVPLYLDYANDTMFGDISGVFPDELPAFGAASAAFDYVLGCDDPDPLMNTVEIAYHEESGESFINTAVATVDIVHPMLEAYYECQDPPPPPGGDVAITLALTNAGDVAIDVMVLEPPIYSGPVPLGIGESLDFTVLPECEGDLACVVLHAIGQLPSVYGIDFPIEVALDACCPCNGSSVEEESWGVIKALYRD